MASSHRHALRIDIICSWLTLLNIRHQHIRLARALLNLIWLCCIVMCVYCIQILAHLSLIHLNLFCFVFWWYLHTVSLLMIWSLHYLRLIKRVSRYFFLLLLLNRSNQVYISNSDILISKIFILINILIVSCTIKLVVCNLSAMWLVVSLISLFWTSTSSSFPLWLSLNLFSLMFLLIAHFILLKMWAQSLRWHLLILLVYTSRRTFLHSGIILKSWLINPIWNVLVLRRLRVSLWIDSRLGLLLVECVVILSNSIILLHNVNNWIFNNLNNLYSKL